MLTIIFIAAVIWVAVRLFIWSLKTTWGIAKFIAAVLLLPVVLIGLFFMGFAFIAIPVLLIMGIIAVVRGLATV